MHKILILSLIFFCQFAQANERFFQLFSQIIRQLSAIHAPRELLALLQAQAAVNLRQNMPNFGQPDDPDLFGTPRRPDEEGPMLTTIDGNTVLTGALGARNLIGLLQGEHKRLGHRLYDPQTDLYQVLNRLAGGSMTNQRANLIRFGQLGSGALGNGLAFFVLPGGGNRAELRFEGSAIYHTDNTALALENAAVVFGRLLQERPCQEDTHVLLGEFLYWLTVADQYREGNEAIAELMFQTTAHHLGYRAIFPGVDAVYAHFAPRIRDILPFFPGHLPEREQALIQAARGLVTLEAFMEAYRALVRIERL